ncbi:hypothetical protein NCCP2716_05800 [Sporosarcina sp. NCCP-2716]|uniref:5-formyltetrahydrofolate cyclo-ligase n=1 Tax=Sporosarcina sp. NCCP-2716 TaxID=2943679 RepID=UPI002040DCD0|nr:5-formyltetrahydrofolate cyclo-ligase [Sporosarcina sp. NCCP-2716]GKV68082.1 hypothetical protein NCCP2716_05800 [Sporosarcina sp. NCCP-2716]
MGNSKSIIRKSILARLDRLTEDEYDGRSARILSRLTEDGTFTNAHSVALTVSRGREVDTRRIIEACWQAGKRVSVPKCIPDTRAMDFYEIASFSQLEMVYLDLLEPITEQTVRTASEELDLIIVPGVAFSPAGFRIGYGGGYYDRFLHDFGGRTVSLAFETQLVEDIPASPHDIPVNKIITEERVILCRKTV